MTKRLRRDFPTEFRLTLETYDDDIRELSRIVDTTADPAVKMKVRDLRNPAREGALPPHAAGDLGLERPRGHRRPEVMLKAPGPIARARCLARAGCPPRLPCNWRTNSDYSVVQTLEQLNSKDKNHYVTDTYEAMLSQKTISLLFQNFKSDLKLEEIILNSRRFASFLLGRSQALEFVLRPVIVKEAFEKDAVKEMILTKSHRELGINKSTLWYQRKHLRETGSVRLYNKTRPYFAGGPR